MERTPLNSPWGFPGGAVNPSASAGDACSIPELGRPSGGGNGSPLQYSCLENPVDRSLVGYSPQGCKESNTTETLTLSLSWTGRWIGIEINYTESPKTHILSLALCEP